MDGTKLIPPDRLKCLIFEVLPEHKAEIQFQVQICFYTLRMTPQRQIFHEE